MLRALEGLHMLLEAEDWMVKLDFKDAYLQVPIHPKFLQFQWEKTT